VTYLAKRLVLYVPVIILVTFFVFLLARMIPGDTAIVLLAGGGSVNQQELDRLREDLGIDRPFYVQYGTWLLKLLQGDLGTSLAYGDKSFQEIKPRIEPTVELALFSLALSVVLAVPIGALSAVKRDSVVDYAARCLTFTGISIPIFVTGLVTIYALVRVFGWLPPLEWVSFFDIPSQNLQQVAFPVLCLTFFELNFTARITRSAMLEVLREEYITAARAKGVGEMRLILHHALKNALLPILTVSGWSLARLLGGTVVVEKIFLVPGMGTLLLDAITARDYVLIQAVVLVFAVAVLTVNLVVDLLYAWLDPRVRYV
jgi:peptide/nickel transport system permease protein